MKKLATLLISTALVGGLSLTAFAPAASAAGAYAGTQRGNFAGQQMQQVPGAMQGYGMQRQNVAPGQGMRGQGIGPQALGPQNMGPQNMGPQRGQGNLVHFTCSANGAPRLEIALNNISSRLTLSADQKTLFDAFKTSALTAQTTYADACEVPTANAGTPLNPVDLLKLRQTNETANIAAIGSVLPALESFYNSLSDAQKATLATPVRANFQVGQGQGVQGQFNQRGMHRGMGQGNFAPGNGQGFGPGNGQGFGPNNMQAPAPQNNG